MNWFSSSYSKGHLQQGQMAADCLFISVVWAERLQPAIKELEWKLFLPLPHDLLKGYSELFTCHFLRIVHISYRDVVVLRVKPQKPLS